MFASTESITNFKDPKFTHRTYLQYFFSVKQEIRIEVVDISTNSVAGRVEFIFADMMKSPSQSLTMRINKTYPAYSNEESFITLRIDHFTECLDEVRLQFAANFFKSYVFTPKTFFTLWKTDPKTKKYELLLKSEPFVGNVPIWPIIRVKVMELCEKDFTRPLRLVVHKIPKLHQEKIMGHIDFTLDDIFDPTAKSVDLVKFKQKPGGPLTKKSIGKVFIQKKQLIRIPQFVDYVFAGLDLFSVVGIDFSNKKKSYSSPDSAHYCTEDGETQYEKAFKLLTEILAPYSATKSVDAYGFGANKLDLMNDCVVDQSSEIFPLSNNAENCSYSEPSTMSNDYKSIMKALEPTEVKSITSILKSIIAQISKDANFNSKARYYIINLLIEDDIPNFQELVDYLTPISNQIPLTLILIGVGKATYTMLNTFHILSGKWIQYTDSKGHVLEQHTAVFLSLQDARDSAVALVKEVLKVVPDRVYASMQKRNICPEKGELTFNPSNNEVNNPYLSTSPDTLIRVRQSLHHEPKKEEAAEFTKQRSMTHQWSNGVG